MKISYRWLQALVPELADPPERIAARLAMYGAPVEEIVRLGEELGDIVIGRVVAVDRHPNADRLSLCVVDAGAGEPIQVVCGAPNVRVGGFYPFAPVGARLPGGVEIRKAKIRGAESRGMLCSERELNLGRDHGGIMELPAEWPAGAPFAAALGLDDVQLVLEITANRPDLLSHIGVARELAGRRWQLPAFPGTTNGGDALTFAEGELSGTVGGVTVAIEDSAGCTRYLGAVIRGVTIRPSPPWLAARLRAVGLRPINNVVDATNYVLYELGQPLHAFDLRRLVGPAIRVRRAGAGEQIVTLDGVTRALDPGTLVISDAAGAVAVAGVMGGAESEITADTADIFLECAIFDPKTVRRGRRSLNLSTDSSYRFERGVDPEGCRRAVARAIDLILTVAGGTVDGEVLDVRPHRRMAPVVGVRPSRVATVLGAHFDAPQIEAILRDVGFDRVEAEEPDGDGRLWFRVPGHRWYDVSIEVDLIEEIARRHGYDAFAGRLGAFRPSSVPDDALARVEERLRGLLVGRGLFEARTVAFAPESDGEVELLNPLSSEERRLRAGLLRGLIRRLEYNFARGARNVRLFELGTAFAPGVDGGGLPREYPRLAVILTGARRPPTWSEAVEPFEIWDLKGLADEIARSVGFHIDERSGGNPGSLPASAGDGAVPPGLPGVDGSDAILDAGLSWVIRAADGSVVGRCGRLRDDRVDSPPWADPAFGLEIDLSLAVADPPAVEFRPLPLYPAIERDVALLVPESVSAAAVEDTIRAAGPPWLEALWPFDVFTGRGVAAGTRSIAWRLRFRAPDRTLKDAEVDDAMARVLHALKEAHGVELRG